MIDKKDYDTVEISKDQTLNLCRHQTKQEREEYVQLLQKYRDVFVWSMEDLIGIPAKCGEHRIDLIQGSIPVRQK